MMNGKTISILSGILLCAVLLAGIPAKDAIPGQGAALLPEMSDRAFWNHCVDPRLRSQIIALGDKVPVSGPVLPGEELYMEYARTGSRAGYEKVYFDYLASIDRLALAACLSGEEKYVRRLESLLAPLCGLPSWLLPAHDVGQKNWKGEVVTIDLVSSGVGWRLALLRQVFRSRFRAETISMLDRELEKRIVAPFERMVAGRQPPHWLYSRNNWSIVCLANVGGTLLGADLAPERRWKLLDAVIKHSTHFLDGFGKDGYCSEGMSYWSYGFGHYLMLSLALYKASDGKLNLMDRPQARLAGEYPEKIRISGTLFPAFSDCTPGVTMPRNWIGVRDCLTGTPSEYWKSVRIYSRPSFIEAALLLNFPAPDAKELSSGPAPASFSEFPDAGIFVMRPAAGAKTRLSAAVKGGSNDEFHNHNDVGGFVLAVDGTVPVIVDPGAEYYSGRSFSSRRYESNLNNSFGHSVPRINGELQIAGKNTRSKVVKKEVSDEQVRITFDIRNAYRQVPGIGRLERTFRYSREGAGLFEVTDKAEFGTPMSFETALITFGTWKETAPGKLLLSYRGKSLEVVIDCGGAPFKVSSEEIREKIRWKENPHRIAVTLSEPVEKAEIRMSFRTPESLQ